MKPSAFLLLALAALALPSPAAQTGHAVYRPGLTQARIPLGSTMGYVTAYQGIPVLASNLLASAETGWLDRTLGVFKDGAVADDAENPVSGRTWPWLVESLHGVFAYEGEVFVEEGTNYYFYARCADGAAMVVDGETVVWQGYMSAFNSAPVVRRFWTAPKTGWVPFNLWFWTFENRITVQWSEWGAQYNIEGVAVEGEEVNGTIRTLSYNSTTNVWSRFVDPGNGTFLRTVTDERFTTVGASEAVSGGRSFALSFADVPTNATLVAFTGPYDGGHATSEWATVSAALAQVPAGDSTATVTVPFAADAHVLRFRLSTGSDIPSDGIHPFEEWTEMIAVSDAPVVRLDSAVPGYTNVVVAGSLGSFGLGGASAGVTIQVAAADDAAFADPVATMELPDFSAVGSFSAELFSLATNTAYLVRATATNDFGVAGASSALAIRTAEPGPAAASLAVSVAAFQSATLAATVSDWGGGSWDAQAWIDVSEDESFPAGATQTLGPLAISGHLPATASATATGLDPDSPYFARARVANSWGVETVSETVSFRTSSDPIHFPEATATATKGYVSVSLSPTFVADGTTYTVAFYAEGPGFSGTWKRWSVPADDEPPFEWDRSTRPGALVTFRYTIDWTYGDRTGQIVVEGDTTAKLADHEIDSLPKLDPAYDDGEYKGLYLRPGETIAVTPSAGATIDWHTNAVLSVTPTNGVYLIEAREAGATLLFEIGADGFTNNVTAVAIVLPAEDPPGGIYVHRALKNWDWNDPDEWEVVVPGSGDYPNGAGSMAIIASGALGPDDGQRNIEIVEPTTVGWLAVGQLGWIRHGYMTNGITKNIKSHNPWIFSDQKGAGGSLCFDTGDGSASWIRLLGHSYTTSRTHFEVPISMANDLDIDELDRFQDTAGWQNTRYRGLWFEKPFDIGTNTLRTIRSYPYLYRFSMPGFSHGSGMESTGWVSFRNNVLGSGTIRLEAQTAVGLCGADGAHVSPFTGTWDVANGDLDPRINFRYGAAALNTYGLSIGRSKEMIIRGSWHRAEKTWPRGALVRTGFNDVRTSSTTSNGCQSYAWTNNWEDAVPPKITLDGGDLQLQPQGPMNSAAQALASSTGIRRNLFLIDMLTVPSGPMGRLDFRNKNNSTSYANARTEITNLVMEPGAVVSFDIDPNLSNVSTEVFIVNDPSGWTPDENSNDQFLPFFFANNLLEGTGGNTIGEMSSTTFDNTRLAFRDRSTGKVSVTNTVDMGDGYKRWTAGEELAGGTSYYSMQLASGVTNSFAPGATVLNLAGYVDMRKGAALGRPGEDAGATLDFGDQPARIFNGNWGEVGTIGCRLAGSAGLVTGGNGTIALAASAEGVAGGVRVAGGTLALGVPGIGGTNFVGRVAGDVRVEAGSRLVVRDKASFAPGVRLFLNDRDWIPSYAHVRLESNASAAKLFVCGEAMPNGYYGSSEAALVHSDINVDDVHFEGPGVLWAGVRPTMMIFR